MSQIKKIAVMTSGGDSPGMNAFIRAVVRYGIAKNIEVYGIYEGYQGLIENRIKLMDFDSVCNIIQRGGTILKSSRSQEFREPEGREKAAENLKAIGIDALICCGGNGSYLGLEAFSQHWDGLLLGAPGTIDNDIQHTDYTIGYDTAVNTAVQAIDNLRDTGDSHNMSFIVEVMGRHCGDIARQVGIASGAIDVLMPETKSDIEAVLHTLRSSGHNIIIVAEGDETGGAIKLSEVLTKKYCEGHVDCKPNFRVCILGHIQRGGRPTARDRILSVKMAEFLIDEAFKGESLKAVGVKEDKLVLTALK